MKMWNISLIIITLVFFSCSKTNKPIAETNINNKFVNTVIEGDIIIDISPESEANIETIGNHTFYGSGTKLTALLVNQNNSYPLENIIWEIDDVVDIGTTINNGILTVARAEHGRPLTISATSKEMNKSGKITLNEVVFCLPSYLYGTWLREKTNYDTIILIVSSDTFETKRNAVYHYINSLEYLRTTDWGLNEHPGGYSLSGKVLQKFNGSSDIKVSDSISITLYPYPENDGLAWNDDNSIYIKQILP